MPHCSYIVRTQKYHKALSNVENYVTNLMHSGNLVVVCHINFLHIHQFDNALGCMCCILPRIIRFIGRGGWDMLYTWLKDAKTDENIPFLADLLKVYQNIPMTVDVLKMNNTPKTIKSLAKSEDDCKFYFLLV